MTYGAVGGLFVVVCRDRRRGRWLFCAVGLGHLVLLLLEALPRVARTAERVEDVGELIKDAPDREEQHRGHASGGENDDGGAVRLGVAGFPTGPRRGSL